MGFFLGTLNKEYKPLYSNTFPFLFFLFLSFGLKAQTPTAGNDSFNECLGVATKLKVLDNDFYGDNIPTTMTLAVVTAPTNGTATTNNNGTTTYPYDDFIDYSPNSGFTGTSDSFVYQITDSNGNSVTATATITFTLDTDGDGISDACDFDDDNDGILNTVENTSCPTSALSKSGAWSEVGSGASTTWTATAGTVGITVSATDYGSGTGFTLNNFQTNDALACSGAYSDPTMVNNPSLSIRHTFPNTASITFTFDKTVKNPILHLDRLGGGGGNTSDNKTTASLLTVTTPGITLTELTENDSHFNVSPTTITRKAGLTYIATPSECGPPLNGTAAGSVRLNGTFTTVTFQISMNPDQPANVNDRFEIAFSDVIEVCDTDNDGTPDSLDTDSDNDGCPDAIEGSGGTKEYILSDLLANNGINIATYPVGTDGVPGTSAATSAPQGVGSSIDSNTVVCCDATVSGFPDKDGDNITDTCDLDDDNDGILDTVELRCDQPNAANSNFGTGTLQDQLYFFNWTNAVFNDGIHIGDSQTFNIGTGADILQVVATVTAVSGVGGDYLPTDMATWVNGAFAKAYNTPGNREAFYGGIGDSIDVTITFVGTKNGVPYPLDLLAFDPESTGPGEQMVFTTNGENWEFVETIETRGGTNGTYTVSGQTLTAAETYVTGSSLYVSNNASEIRTQVSVSGGREGVAYGLFLRCDTDNDGIPNSSDTDSDNDGCPDAVEAAGSFSATQLTTLAGGSNGAGSSLLNFGTTVNTTQGSANYGVPIQDANGLAIAANMPQAIAAAVLDNTINTCQADLSLTKRVDKAIVKVGDTIIYTLTLKNDGSGVATGVQVTDVLPTGITYVSDNSATTSTTYTSNVWNVGSLNVNQTKSLQITATVSGVGAIVNTVQVTQSNQTDPDSTPNNGS